MVQVNLGIKKCRGARVLRCWTLSSVLRLPLSTRVLTTLIPELQRPVLSLSWVRVDSLLRWTDGWTRAPGDPVSHEAQR